MSYTTGQVDYNKAKIAAYIVVAGFMAIMLVFGIRSAGGPELHDGDKVESLPCPVCGGSGEGKQAGTRCQACLGNKKLKAVIPGPNHPVSLRGTVRNLKAFKDQAEADRVCAEDARNLKPSLTPVKGAVPQAVIVFQGSTGTTELASKAVGKFSGVIAPGHYKVAVRVDGFQDYQQELTVAPRAKPIWPEVSGLPTDQVETLQLDILLSPR
jgi:hypothetical protein